MPSGDARNRLQHGEITSKVIRDLHATVREVIGSDAEMSLMQSGVSSINYYASSSSGDYVVRVDLFRPPNNIVADFVLAHACRERGTTTPDAPIWLGEIHQFPVSIRSFVYGPTLAEMKHVPPKVYGSAGRQLALIHKTCVECDRQWFYGDPLARYADMELPKQEIASRALSVLQTAQERLSPGAWSLGLVHTDFRAENLVLHNMDVVVLDWEKATIGPLLFDLALALFHILTDPTLESPKATTIEFLKGYTAVRPMSLVERESLGDMVRCAASVYYLVDSEIWLREISKDSMSEIDNRHAAYFMEYCTPRYSYLLDHWETIDLLSLVRTSVGLA